MFWYKVYSDSDVIDVVRAENAEQAIESVQSRLKQLDKLFTSEGTIWKAKRVDGNCSTKNYAYFFNE